MLLLNRSVHGRIARREFCQKRNWLASRGKESATRTNGTEIATLVEATTSNNCCVPYQVAYTCSRCNSCGFCNLIVKWKVNGVACSAQVTSFRVLVNDCSKFSHAVHQKTNSALKEQTEQTERVSARYKNGGSQF